ncbi:MAG TPA: YkgJ family cysteine cluster protein [Actinobacteria bacterium]|nr:YkgJ family cysteine cluster protein [Actinomycetota bacterium]
MKKTDTKALHTQLEDLLKMVDEEKISRRLEYVYNQVPRANCGACFKCCFTSAQVYPLEFLNILSYLVTLPELTKSRLSKKIVEYELLHLTTLKHSCPFLENESCSVEDQKPILCRLFGFYSEDEHRNMSSESRKHNQQLAMAYARNERILLPEEVMTHDVEFCAPNLDKKGDSVLINPPERERLFQQIYSLSEQVVPDDWLEPDHDRFSYRFMRSFITEEEIDKAKTKAIKEFQADGTTQSVARLLSKHGFQI